MIECFTVIKKVENKGLETKAKKVSLNFEQRQKSRYRALTDNGEEIGWFLPRANILADGDCLQSNQDELFVVVAANETLSEVCCDDTLLLTKAAYHLGNRHVPLQISEGVLCYQHDHVLDAMVVGLGLQVRCVEKPFHPENGAYHESSHSHGHSHSHGGGHSHSHGH